MTDWTTARIQDAERLASVLSEKLDDDAPLNLRTRWLPLAEELWRRITPVLDADGLPVVRTVGDLTARHIGRRVRVDGFEGELVAFVALFDGIVTVEVLTDDDLSAPRRCTIDTPVEVIE